jgi:hypothetical protein
MDVAGASCIVVDAYGIALVRKSGFTKFYYLVCDTTSYTPENAHPSSFTA